MQDPPTATVVPSPATPEAPPAAQPTLAVSEKVAVTEPRSAKAAEGHGSVEMVVEVGGGRAGEVGEEGGGSWRKAVEDGNGS